MFQDKIVKGFKTSNKNQKENIKIKNYSHNDKFIIELNLKNKNDRLILVKGYDMNSP